jgi:LysM repeat protein
MEQFLMMRKILGGFALFLIAAMLFPVNGAAQAQTNLLQDPSFETTETYKRVVTDPIDNTTNFDVPPAWSGWAIVNTPGDPNWKNRVPTGFPHTGLFKIHEARSLHIARGFATFTTAVYQSVTVPDKANVRGSARGFMERGKQGEPTPGGQFKVGIDPNGGSNPLDPAVVWSNTATNDDGWVQLSVDATAAGTRVTLFLYATQSDPADPNGIYWDDASLTVGGQGGSSGTAVPTSPPVPTPPPFASFVVPQAPQPDGSIVHIVGPDEVFNAILVAYGVSQAEVLQLNNLSAPPRILQIGQKLVIRPAAPGGSSSADIAEQQEEDTALGTEEANAEVVETDEVQETEETTATEDSAPTDIPATRVIPTDPPPAPVTQVAQNTSNVSGVCVSMFDDANKNRIREQSEALLGEGVITLISGGETVETYTTDGASEPFCLPDLAAGIYTASAQPPEGYGLTTSPQLSLRVQAGIAVNASFGAAQGVEAAVIPPAESGEDSPQTIVEETANEQNPVLQNLGLIVFGLAGFVLVVGLGTALVLRRR